MSFVVDGVDGIAGLVRTAGAGALGLITIATGADVVAVGVIVDVIGGAAVVVVAIVVVVVVVAVAGGGAIGVTRGSAFLCNTTGCGAGGAFRC